MSIISLKKKSGRFGGLSTGVSVAGITEALQGAPMFSMESANVFAKVKEGNSDQLDLNDIAANLAESLEAKDEHGNYINEKGLAVAALIAASTGQKPSDWLKLSMESRLTGGNVVQAQALGAEFDSVYTTESFDNQNLLNHLSISIGLNYKISRQGPAMEMVYRTIPLTPEQGGVDIEVPNLYVQNTLRHPEDGTEADFGLRRVIDAAIDYTVLNDQGTTLIPAYNDTTKDQFVATSVVTPFEYVAGRRTVTTSAVLVGKTVNLFGLGTAGFASRVGQADYTEALDRNIGVAGLYLTLGGDTLHFDVKGLPFSRFVKTPEQGSRGLKLDFPLTTIVIDKDTVNYAGAALTDATFTAIATGEYSVRLRMVINGSADVERGTVAINPSSVEVMSITNAAGDQIPLDSGAGADIVTGLANLTVAGWWPDARLTNTNHRHLGLMLNVRGVSERFLTRVRAPIFVPYPLSEDRDQTVMDWLTFAVGSYINNEAVGTLIGYHERLMRLTGGLRGDLVSGDFEINAMPIEGIGRYLVNPYIQELSVDLLANTQSLDTLDKVENGQETLINTLRSVAFDILQRTGYENACRYMDGGEITKKWKFALVTSKKIETFLTVKGDSRTLGANLPFQLESDIDARLDGSIYMTLVREGDEIDVLSAGCMLLTPTLVSTISVTRDNAPRNEAVVQPRFQHYNLLPIIVKVNVAGVTELLEESLPFKVENEVVTP